LSRISVLWLGAALGLLSGVLSMVATLIGNQQAGLMLGLIIAAAVSLGTAFVLGYIGVFTMKSPEEHIAS